MSVRMTVTFTDPQMKWLKKEAKRLGITTSDAVRRTIDELREVADRSITETLGMDKDRG